MLLILAGCGTAPDLETSRRFQDAEQRFAEAKTAQEFSLVAARYQEIIDSGFVSGVVFYNQGNAWMNAGQRGRAIASYRQAQNLIPRDPYLAANLSLALDGRSDASFEILDYVFFWEDHLALTETAWIATAFLVLAVITLLVAQLDRQVVIMRRVGWTAFLLALLMGGSTARQWWAVEQQSCGCVVAVTASARKGPAESFEPAFTAELSEGTEFRVIGREGDWIHAEIADAGAGWIPESACVTW